MSARELVEQTQRELVELLSHEQASLAVAQRCSGIARLGAAVQRAVELSAQRRAPWGGATGSGCGPGRDASAGTCRSARTIRLTLSVDDLGEGFGLTAQAVRESIRSACCDLMHTALGSLVEALEEHRRAPSAVAVDPAGERAASGAGAVQRVRSVSIRRRS